MNKPKYNPKESSRIMWLIESKDYNNAIIEIEKYIKDYPNDNEIRTTYITLLLKLGKTEYARYLLETTTIVPSDLECSKKAYFFCWIKCLLIEGKYQECLNFLIDNDNLYYTQDAIYYVRAFCKKKLNQKIYDADISTYTYQQIVDYSEELAFSKVTDVTKKTEDSLIFFNHNIDISKLFSIIKPKLDESFKFYSRQLSYESIFKLDNCGIYNNKTANFILARALLHSNDILYLSPSVNENKCQYIDINSEFYDLSNPTKQLSQIDKFNQRYKKSN